MDPVEEFCADWAYHQESLAREQARIASQTSAIHEARRKLPALIQAATESLAIRLGPDARVIAVGGSSPFIDSRRTFSFGGALVDWDIDQHMSDHQVELIYSVHPHSHIKTMKVEVLSLTSEVSVYGYVLRALRELLNLRSRPRLSPWGGEFGEP